MPRELRNQIKEQLPGRERSVWVAARDNRLFVEAVICRYRAGIPWRRLRERSGNIAVRPTQSAASKTREPAMVWTYPVRKSRACAGRECHLGLEQNTRHKGN